MNLNFYIDYFRRCHKGLQRLSEQGNGNYLYLWYDFLKCAIVHGTIINHYTRGHFYSLKGCERKRSMTYRRILKVYKVCNNRKVQHLLENKAHFNKHFSSVVKRGWLLSYESTFEDFENLCKISEDLIVKPFDGVNGQDISKVSVPENREDRKQLFLKLSNQRLIIEECIKQHSMLSIGGRAVNTIRAFTIMDKNGEVHLLKMLLRVGVGDSVVDNYSAGGCVYEVDVQTGIVISPSLTKKGTSVYIHPGTDVCMLGYRLPNWTIVKESLIKAQKLIPENRFTGWDVAITNDGVEFIEGNHNPGYELLEFFGSKGWYDKVKKYI